MKLKKKNRGDTFASWIDKVGPYDLAERLGVRSTTTYYWRSGKSPSVPLMRLIRKLYPDAPTYEQMIQRTGAR